MKNKTAFVCRECGYMSVGWQGKCPECGEWNSLVEEVVTKKGQKPSKAFQDPVGISDIEWQLERRIDTGWPEFNRVLGGGIVEGEIILLAGDPGIGKSTLALQCANSLKTDKMVLYVTGEESLRQIKLRAERLMVNKQELLIFAETNLELIITKIEEYKPVLVIIDSIQTMYLADIQSTPGSVSQLRESTAKLMRIAKNQNIAILLVGHVTKEGSIAGPRILEHMVDAVLYFEGERHYQYRILRSFKNRYGSTDELGVFQMEKNGLIEVKNPSEVFLAERPAEQSGSVVVPCVEGSRPILIELQALSVKSFFGQPRRMTTGPDVGRTSMLMAVLEKKLGLRTGEHDIYINIIGGLKIGEPALDLGIIVAVSSSMQNLVVDKEIVVMGEVGLTGEVRSINHLERRLAEAEKMGFKKAIVPASNAKRLKKEDLKIEIIPVENAYEAFVKSFRNREKNAPASPFREKSKLN